MCRNIRTLYNFDPPATSDEIHASALQYVRKISGFTKPSKANEEAFAAPSTRSPTSRLTCWPIWRPQRQRATVRRGGEGARRAAKRYAA